MRQIGVGSIPGYGRPVDDGLVKEIRLYRCEAVEIELDLQEVVHFPTFAVD